MAEGTTALERRIMQPGLATQGNQYWQTTLTVPTNRVVYAFLITDTTGATVGYGEVASLTTLPLTGKRWATIFTCHICTSVMRSCHRHGSRRRSGTRSFLNGLQMVCGKMTRLMFNRGVLGVFTVIHFMVGICPELQRI